MAFEIADVRFSTRIARQSLKAVFFFAVGLIAILLAERYLFQSGAERAAGRVAAALSVRNDIILADEKLTMSAIAYAQSADVQWKSRYEQTVPAFNAAITRAKMLVSDTDAMSFDKSTRAARDVLTELEMTTFDLVLGGWNADAANIFGSPRYLESKKTLIAGTDQLLAKVDAEAQAAVTGLRVRTALTLLLACGAGLAGGIWLWRRLGRALDKAEATFVAADKAYYQQVADGHVASLKKSRLEQLGALIATFAHELRNPLGAVRTSAFTLERKFGSSDPAVVRSFERIRNGIARCDNIISQFLDYSRIGEARKSTGNLDDWLADTVTEMSKTLHETINLHCILGIGDRPLPFDPQSLRKAVAHLVTNAAEATQGRDPVNAMTHAIGIESRLTARGAEIVITDNGPGIANEQLNKVIEPLFTTKSFGAGLGLPSAQRIAETHGGGIEIANGSGGGARVTIWLPAAEHAPMVP